MFGPDKCGSDAKLHFIFRHVHPKNGSVEEKHVKKLDVRERWVVVTERKKSENCCVNVTHKARATYRQCQCPRQTKVPANFTTFFVLWSSWFPNLKRI